MDSVITSVPVIRGEHGARLYAFAGVLKPKELLGFIGHDFRSKKWKTLPESLCATYKEVQRSTAPGRVTELTDYITNRMINGAVLPGALPAISIAVDEPVDFNPIDAAHQSVGSVSFALSALRLIADGIGRATAILDLHEDAVAGLPDIPIVIYAPREGKLSRDALSQQFADFNGKGSKLTPAAAGARDRSNPVGNVGKEMIQLAVFKTNLGKNHGVTEDKAFRFVRCVFEKVATDKGRSHRIISPVLNNNREAEASDVMRYFWNRFAAAVGNDFDSPTSIIFRSAAQNAIAFTLNALTNGQPLAASRDRIEAIADAMGKIDWQQDNAEWLNRATYSKGDNAIGFISTGNSLKNTFDYVLEMTTAKLPA